MLLFMKILVIISCWVKPIRAELKNCSDHERGKPQLCLRGNEEYGPPLSVNLYLDLYLGEIVDIDQNKKSISMTLGLITYWNDPKIALTNDSIE